MTQALDSAIQSINALNLEEKHQLLEILGQILDEAIAHSLEENWMEDIETTTEIQQVREEYKKGEYITFDQYLAQRQA